jgi:choline dehydrogenase-like flavoprotein
MTRHQVVVIGSGAGGGTAARTLAEAGLDVLLLEMGAALGPEQMRQREEQMIPQLFQDAGARRTVDQTITVLQGQGLGGSTLHNLNLVKRIPPALLEQWERSQSLAGLSASLTEDYDWAERELKVSRIEDHQVNRANQLFSQGCSALGLRQARLLHNRVGCVGSGFCELGCAYNAKMNSARVMIPAAVAAGAKVETGLRVTQITSRFGRVNGVRVQSADGRPRQIGADAVVLAASATNSAALVLASGLDDPHRRSGRGLHLHPGTTVAALFDTPVKAWSGIPQSIECTELLDAVDPNKRVWIVPAFAHPAGAAGLMSGFGPELMGLMRQYRHLAAAAPMLHDYGAGHITATSDGRPRMHYRLDPGDARALAQGMAMTARIWLAAGAQRVILPGIRPIFVSSLAEAARVEAWDVQPLDPPLVAVHPQGGLAMAGDPRRGPVDPEGRHRGARGLYVADGSLFPSSTGVPPQLTIYALGRRVGRTVARDLGAG